MRATSTPVCLIVPTSHDAIVDFGHLFVAFVVKSRLFVQFCSLNSDELYNFELLQVDLGFSLVTYFS